MTGATHGIGFACALELLREGATVIVNGLLHDADEGMRAFAAEGFTPSIICGDLGNATFCEELVDAASKVGAGRIDYLVNNAFSFLSKGLDATAADFERSNAVGPVAFALLIKLCTPYMRAAGGGAIVNVSSISSWVAQPNRWTYNMAKGAVTMLTRCAALDLAPSNIRVNSVSPAWTWTRENDKAAGGDRERFDPIWGKFHMLRRCADPSEIAGPVLFLLSSDASFVTGTDLPVDGGYNALGPEGLGESTVFAGTA